MRLNNGHGAGLGTMRLNNGHGAGLGTMRLYNGHAGFGHGLYNGQAGLGHGLSNGAMGLNYGSTGLGAGHAVMAGSCESNRTCCYESCDKEVFHNFDEMRVFCSRGFFSPLFNSNEYFMPMQA